MKKVILKLIRLYQISLSPDHGVFSFSAYRGCKYYPSCSEYTYKSIEARGLFIGILKGLWRVVRCNPFSHGGYDPVKK